MLGADRKSVSFMRSYPNLIPLGASDVRRILAAVEQLRYDRMYGNPGWDKRIDSGGPALVERSAERYVGWISR